LKSSIDKLDDKAPKKQGHFFQVVKNISQNLVGVVTSWKTTTLV